MRILKNNYSVPEKFFVQRLEELIHSKTLDTYRNKLHNPKTILTELKELIIDFKSGELRNEDHIKKTAQEALRILNKKNGLTFDGISFTYFKKLLSEIKVATYSDVLHCVNIYLSANKNYISVLVGLLKTEITIQTENYAKYIEGEKDENGKVISWYLDDINLWTGYLATELVANGYSKSRIKQLTFKKLVKTRKTFDQAFRDFSITLSYQPIAHKVFVNVKIPSEIIESICHLNKHILEVKKEGFTEPIIKTFIECKGRPRFNSTLCFSIKAMDFEKAAYLVRTQMSSIIDFINIGHKDSESEFWHHFLVFNPRNSKIGGVDTLQGLFGNYRSDATLYETISDKFQKISSNKKVDTNVKDVLRSGVRYFRLGDESIEPELKLLNYWIGLENIFSFAEDTSNLVNTISLTFSKIHSLSYFKRNLDYLNMTIERLNLGASITGFDPSNSRALNDSMVMQQLITNSLPSNPLMTFRAYRIKELIEKNDKLKSQIDNHMQDLQSNIYRIYRVRNAIVHSALLDNSIIELASHLQYYLLFMLSSILDFFTHKLIDIDNDEKVTMRDYFIWHKLSFDSLTTDKIDSNSLMNFNNPLSSHLV